MLIPGSDVQQLEQLKKIIEKKKGSLGTKAQLKPSFTEGGECDKVAVVVKWGGEVRFWFRTLCGNWEAGR